MEKEKSKKITHLFSKTPPKNKKVIQKQVKAALKTDSKVKRLLNKPKP